MVPVMSAVKEAGRNLPRRDVKGHLLSPDASAAACPSAAMLGAGGDDEEDDDDDDAMAACKLCVGVGGLCCEHAWT